MSGSKRIQRDASQDGVRSSPTRPTPQPPLSGDAAAEEHPRAAGGPGLGAAGNALLGGLLGRHSAGVVVGGLLGRLAGGAIGPCLDRQGRTGTQAAAAAGYHPSQGSVVHVERVQAEPATLAPGGTVYLATTYTVLTPNPGDTVGVQETREVRQNGVLVANPTTAFTRTNGTFTSALPITLPTTAARGTYEVTITVAAHGRASRGLTIFLVQ